MTRSVLRVCGWVALAVALALATTLSACHGPQSGRGSALPFADPPRRPTAPVLLVLTPPAPDPWPVIDALRDEAGSHFDVFVRTVAGPSHRDHSSERGGADEIATTMAKLRPAAVVLLNNSSVLAYRRWALTQPAPPPSLILMTAFAEELQRTVPGSRAISYETPAVTALVGLRGTFGVSVRRAGTVARPSFARYLDRQQALAAVEQIELVREPVSETPTAEELRRALERLATAELDALWVLNDNRLLEPSLLERAWLPFVARFERPIVVGVPSLIRSHPSFGTYAAVPDLDALGVQAADLLLELDGPGAGAPAVAVHQPLSVEVLVDATQARRMGLRLAEPHRIDRLVR